MFFHQVSSQKKSLAYEDGILRAERNFSLFVRYYEELMWAKLKKIPLRAKIRLSGKLA